MVLTLGPRNVGEIIVEDLKEVVFGYYRTKRIWLSLYKRVRVSASVFQLKSHDYSICIKHNFH